jgi:hypothetical protein
MRRRRAAVGAFAAVLSGAALVAAAGAASPVTKTASRTFTIAPGATRSLLVPYPDALEYAGARYTGTVRVLAPAAGSTGRRPALGEVRIVSTGGWLGGSEFRAVVRNGNPTGTAAARVRVTAVTVEPAR